MTYTVWPLWPLSALVYCVGKNSIVCIRLNHGGNWNVLPLFCNCCGSANVVGIYFISMTLYNARGTIWGKPQHLETFLQTKVFCIFAVIDADLWKNIHHKSDKLKKKNFQQWKKIIDTSPWISCTGFFWLFIFWYIGKKIVQFRFSPQSSSIGLIVEEKSQQTGAVGGLLLIATPRSSCIPELLLQHKRLSEWLILKMKYLHCIMVYKEIW